MSDNKKYYYLRLKDNFFDSDELKILESMKDGYLYSNILLKLYLRSLKNDGKLVVNERIPYSADMLASVTGHQVGTIKQALSVFKDLGLIDVLDNGAIYMLDIQNFIGKGSTEADRRRAYDRKITQEKELLKIESVRNLREISEKSTPEIEIELEKDIEIEHRDRDITISTTREDKEIENSQSFSPVSNIDIYDLWMNSFGVISSFVKGMLDDLIAEYGLVNVADAVRIAKEKGKSRIGYVEGILKNQRLENGTNGCSGSNRAATRKDEQVDWEQEAAKTYGQD